MRQRWGTFSVRDHRIAAPFVSDVLLYDKLVIPVLEQPRDALSDSKTLWDEFNGEEQQACLDILKIKTERSDGLALAVRSLSASCS